MPFPWLQRLRKPAAPKPAAVVRPLDLPAFPAVADGRSDGPPVALAEPEPEPVGEAVTPFAGEISADKIAQRAYEKWAGRGGHGGSPEQDWRDAEAELRAEFALMSPEPLPNKPR